MPPTHTSELLPAVSVIGPLVAVNAVSPALVHESALAVPAKTAMRPTTRTMKRENMLICHS